MFLPSFKARLLLLVFGFIYHQASAINFSSDSLSFYDIHHSGYSDISLLQDQFLQERTLLNHQMQLLDLQLYQFGAISEKKKIELLHRKLQLLEQLSFLENQEELEVLKVRYRKGIELIRLMYEKILGLDHHFSSMQTYQNIAVLSNPNTFPAFKNIQTVIKEKSANKFGFSFPDFWDSNPFLTATFSLVASLVGKGRPEEKSAEIDKISCILDFTLRMNSDLNIVRYETEFLKKANQAMKQECETLFKEYTNILGYLVSLEDCRKNDDWENLQEQLADYTHQLKEQLKKDSNAQQEAKKMEINMEFATQRVADFITKYSNFIQQGIQYYQKFDSIISSYENEIICAQDLPHQFQELKFDIKTTIEKFNNTYNLPEIQGSRLKSLLYGGIN